MLRRRVSPIHKAAFRVPKGAVNLRRATGGLLVRVVSRFLFVQVMYFDLDFYGVVSVFGERFCDGVAIGDGLKGLARGRYPASGNNVLQPPAC